MSNPNSKDANPNSHDSKKSFWESKIEEWRQSGLSQPDFCQQQDLKYSTFKYWQTRRIKRANQAPFVKVNTCRVDDGIQPKTPLLIQVRSVRGLTIQIPVAMGILEIASLVQALEKAYA